MKIYEDYEKIEFNLFGLDLLEPNGFIGNFIIFIVAMIFVYKISKFSSYKDSIFLRHWKRFFLVFGIGFIVGGFGHLLYNYTGIRGKYPAWILGIISTFFIEQAMIVLITKKTTQKTLQIISKAKLVLALTACMIMIQVVDLSADYTVGLRLVAINSTVGLFYATGYLGYRFSRSIGREFIYLYLTIIIAIPIPFIQFLKINLHPWFDRNDLSHLILLLTLFLYYKTVHEHSKRTKLVL